MSASDGAGPHSDRRGRRGAYLLPEFRRSVRQRRPLGDRAADPKVFAGSRCAVGSYRSRRRDRSGRAKHPASMACERKSRGRDPCPRRPHLGRSELGGRGRRRRDLLSRQALVSWFVVWPRPARLLPGPRGQSRQLLPRAPRDSHQRFHGNVSRPRSPRAARRPHLALPAGPRQEPGGAMCNQRHR